MLTRSASVALVLPLVVAFTGACSSTGGTGEPLQTATPIVEVADAGSPAPRACAIEADCDEGELCVEHVCLRGCLRQSDCLGGTVCTWNPSDAGWCYNEPGCNPPPAGTRCPTLCYGYCA